MTSRLKRKLNEIGIDTASNKATENFCLIGTPLPPLEKSKDSGEFIPLWKQEVRDEKGRRRLHGAFTGGFSAGYFNTVGSKEGWTPSTFTSSRSDRSKVKASRPEDFMDEEDLAEIRDGQKLVDNTEEMDIDFWDRGRPGSNAGENDSLTSVLEATLLPAPKDSIGAQILKKMGWRLGHGIGPKLTYEQRKRENTLSHTPTRSIHDVPEVDDHEEAKKHLYPRRDTKPLIYKKKDNVHGIGYTPGMGLNEMIAIESGALSNKKSLGPNISAGFGLGALNEADEDDLDVYDQAFDPGSRRLAYDENEDDERITMNSHNPKTNSQVFSQTSALHKKTQGRGATFDNGLPCLPGFVVYDKPIKEENFFVPPIVPKDWTPDPRRVWEKDKENLNEKGRIDSKQNAAKRQESWRHNALTANERGNLLGETPLPGPTRSIFDYLSPKDRERLRNLAVGKVEIDVQASTADVHTLGPEVNYSHDPSIPRLDAQVAKMALQGFQPFINDPTKHARYTAYLQAQAEAADSVPFGRTPGQSVDVFERELQDYARAAQIFKPVSGAMAGRFTRAAVVEVGPKASEGLHRPSEGDSYLSGPGGEGERGSESEKKEESPKENAARLGMFGALTREVKPWAPARLLCKRFGVKEPTVELPEETASSSVSNANNWHNAGTLEPSERTEAGFTGETPIGDSVTYQSTGGKGGRRDVSNIGLGEDETQGRDILTYERPAMDIFKAIFASDDEDEDEDQEEVDPDKNELEMKRPSANTGEYVPKAEASTKPIELSSTHPFVSNTVDYNDATGKVDLTSFKPTFVPRSDRTKDKEGDRERDREKGKDKDRDRKKKKKHKTLVSFDVEDEGSTEDVRHKKRKSEKKEKKRTTDYNDESLWVEKPPPEAAKTMEISNIQLTYDTTNSNQDTEKEEGPQRGRKRAIDFM